MAKQVLAGRQGFEPRYRGPEPRDLPLDDIPTKWAIIQEADNVVKRKRLEIGRVILLRLPPAFSPEGRGMISEPLGARDRDIVSPGGPEMELSKIVGRLLAGAIFVGVAVARARVAGPAASGEKPLPVINVPDPDIGAQTLAARRAAQEAT